MLSECTNWLQSAIGKKLLRAKALMYVSLDETYIKPSEISLSFEELLEGKFFCASDGSSIAFSFEQLKPVSLGEYGKTNVYDLISDEKFSAVLGQEMQNVQMVRSKFERTICGIQFSFHSGSCLSVLNLGDDLYMFNEIPNDLMREELELVPLASDQ
jgi:hypothetical protein